MKQDEFNNCVTDMIDLCLETLSRKESEYTISDEDRLQEFKVTGILAYESSFCMLKGKMSKHVAKLYMMMKKIDNEEHFTASQWDEVIKDTINYCLLLKALLIDEGEC